LFLPSSLIQSSYVYLIGHRIQNAGLIQTFRG